MDTRRRAHTPMTTATLLDALSDAADEPTLAFTPELAGEVIARFGGTSGTHLYRLAILLEGIHETVQRIVLDRTAGRTPTVGEVTGRDRNAARQPR